MNQQQHEQPIDTVPEDSAEAEMTPQQLAEAEEYGRRGFVCDLADKALDLGYLGAMAFVVAGPLHDWLGGFTFLANDSLRLLAMFLVVIGLHIAVSFPLSLYAGHLLEHKYGLSRLSFAGWLSRYAKRNALAIVFGAVMFVGLYWIIWTVGPWWWLIAAAVFFLVSIVLGQLTPVLILPLFYKIERLDDEELNARMEKISQGTGLSIEGVYRMDLSAETVKANAMLAGMGRTRRVLMGDTLLDGFTPDEIEVIFAHEIGHHVHRHIRKMMATGVLYSLLGLWACDRLLALWIGLAEYDPHTLGVATLPLLMFAITVFSLLTEPLQNIVSRHFERQADRYALNQTGLTEAYISAFKKLAKLNKDDPNPNPVEVFLFHSHPPISERLSMAQRS